MAVEFYVDNWLTAAGAVGLLRITKGEGVSVEGRRLVVEEEVWKKLSYYYANTLLSLGFDVVKKHLETLSKGKESKIKNPYNQLVFAQLSSFYPNSLLTNQAHGYIKEVGQENEEYIKKVGAARILEQDWTTYEKKLRDWIRTAIGKAFEELEKYEEEEKAPLCFFCKERRAYRKEGKYNTLDAVNFSPLSASPNTVENFFYDGKNTMHLCKECEKLLYCAVFGFTKTEGLKRYLFVYLPDELEECRSINDLLEQERHLTKNILKLSLVEASKRLQTQKALWALENIYVVEILPVGDAQSNVYTFSIPPKLADVIKRRIEEYPKYFEPVFDIFLDFVYRRRSLYEMLFYVMSGFLHKDRYKKTKMKTREERLIRLGMWLKGEGMGACLYFIKFQEELNMGENMEKQVNWAFFEGKKLREEYLNSLGADKATKKAEVLSYRLLDAIRRRDVDHLCQNLIRAYLEVEKPVPQVFLNVLKDKGFERVAYAFLMGINAGKGVEDEPSGETEDSLSQE